MVIEVRSGFMQRRIEDRGARFEDFPAVLGPRSPALVPWACARLLL